jgi:hypothetical protein
MVMLTLLCLGGAGVQAPTPMGVVVAAPSHVAAEFLYSVSMSYINDRNEAYIANSSELLFDYLAMCGAATAGRSEDLRRTGPK